MEGYLGAFICLWLYRYLRLIVNCISHWTFQPIPVPKESYYMSEDVTVVIPTLDGDPECLKAMIPTILGNHPLETVVVTIDSNYKKAVRLADEIGCKNVRVLSVPRANKRLQLCRAIPEVTTPITILADDDVLWPSTLLHWMLAPFDSDPIGGVGTCQRLKRADNPSFSQRVWNFLGAIYLERRNFDISACCHMDGGLPCLSGRTVAYRTEILQDEAFKHAFTHETWRTYQLNADDDNFMTRWLVSHGWRTCIQYHKQAEVQTILEDNPRFVKQCLRWSRSNWRSNLTSMFVEREVWTRQPWSTYAVQVTTLTAWSLPTDVMLVYLIFQAAANWTDTTRAYALGLLACWMLMSKAIKLMGHFIRYPIDMAFLPISILFGYAHGFLKLYAMFTLDVTTWGSRENADTDDDFRMIRLPPYTV